ncbi:MAG: ATP-dependent DNA helicase RecG, partial [Treponemataceae bacterium]|nr:ATP-dependent DNA helicase RecG [Treponemataceae bacterium]
MKLAEIKSPVSALPGVGPATVKLFAKLNIFTVAELLQWYPRDYEDRRRRVPIDAFERANVHTVAQVTAHEWFGYGKMRTLKLIVSDGTASAALIAFNRKFLQNSLPVGSIVAITGRFSVKYGQIQTTSFDVTKLADSGAVEDFDGMPLPDAGILPVYALTEGLNQKNVRKAVAAAVSRYVRGIEDELPEKIILSLGLVFKDSSLKFIH